MKYSKPKIRRKVVNSSVTGSLRDFELPIGLNMYYNQ